MQLPVHMAHLGAATAFMQVIHILRDQEDLTVKLPLQSRERAVCQIGLRRRQLIAARVVKSIDQVRVSSKGLRRGDFHGVVVFPEPVRIAKGRQSRFGRHAGSGQYDNLVDVSVIEVRHVIPLRIGRRGIKVTAN